MGYLGIADRPKVRAPMRTTILVRERERRQMDAKRPRHGGVPPIKCGARIRDSVWVVFPYPPQTTGKLRGSGGVNIGTRLQGSTPPLSLKQCRS